MDKHNRTVDKESSEKTKENLQNDTTVNGRQHLKRIYYTI